MPVDNKALGKRIQNARLQAGLTQDMLSEKIDKSRNFLSYIECGDKSMSIDTFVDLVNALETSADSLLLDSLLNTYGLSEDLKRICSDCSPAELKVMCDIVASVKQSIRKHINNEE